MILVIDNYDSFVHNLARYLRLAGAQTLVVRNDAVDVASIRGLAPEAIVMSPGPGTPDQAGCCLSLVEHLLGEIPLLGVCLGHQVLIQACGGKIHRSGRPMHGRQSLVQHSREGILAGMPSPLRVGRYHSLVARREDVPGELKVTATLLDDANCVMAVEHQVAKAWGLQFHPESVLTEQGQLMVDNFVRRIRPQQEPDDGRALSQTVGANLCSPTMDAPTEEASAGDAPSEELPVREAIASGSKRGEPATSPHVVEIPSGPS